MPTIHFGVIDIPHLDGKTTGDIAEILEAKYEVMRKFTEIKEENIVEALAESYSDAIVDVINGVDPSNLNPAAQAASDIEHMLKQAIALQAFDGVIAGVPTQAALQGRSKRFKSGRNPRGSRPSFIDTGMYQSSIKVWVD